MSLFRKSARPTPTPRRDSVVIPFGSQYGIANGTFAEIDLSSFEASLQSIAVRSTVDLIASMASETPFDVLSGQGAERKTHPTPEYMLDPAGDGHGLQDWVYQVVSSWLLRGNAFGEVLARTGDVVTQVEVLHPDCVGGNLDPQGRMHWQVNGRPIPENRLEHWRVNPVPGRVLGLSPIALHADQIGLGLMAARFGKQWFQDGAHPSGMLTNDEVELKETNVRTAKDRFLASMRGSREPLVLGKGWKYQSIQVNAEESQFLVTQGFSEAQCARIFGPGFAEVLGYETASMTYSNRVDRSTDLLVFSMDRWFSRLERLLGRMVPPTQYVKMNRDALLRSTTLDRYKAHALALQNRWKVVNEVRALEDMPPVDWGGTPNTAAPSDPTTDPPETTPASGAPGAGGNDDSKPA